MKKLRALNKLIFLSNNVAAILLLLSFFVPSIKPSAFWPAAVLGLLTPALIIANFGFLLFWILIGFKRQWLLSGVILLVSYFLLSPVYKVSSSEDRSTSNELSVMSYNVRKFNLYQWIEDDSIPQKISQFITEVQPDIVALQEYKDHDDFKLTYPYKSNPFVSSAENSDRKRTLRAPLAIYSKHPIIRDTIIKFNRKVMAIYADIVKNSDTLRIFNFHLQSLGISPDEDFLGHEDSKSLLKRLKSSVQWQERQIDQILEKFQDKRYPTLITCDMNNTAYSWIYKKTKSGLQDTYLKAGKGFGKTYDLKGFPLRIDYILVDKKFEVKFYKNFDVDYSDHQPIVAKISL